MKKMLIFVLFIGCAEHDIKEKCGCFIMTISDAIPIQFWVNGVDTYNQKEVCGITPYCFCQTVNCDDEIRIQLTDDDYDSFELEIIEINSGTTTTLSFSEIADGTHEISFILSDLEICDTQIRFNIVGSVGLLNEDFNSNINSWENFEFSGINSWAWANDGGNGSANSNTIGTDTGYLRQSITISEGDTIIITGEVRGQQITPVLSEFEVVAFDGSSKTILQSFSFAATFTEPITVDQIANEDYTHLGFRATSGGGEHQIYVHSFNVSLKHVVAYSDCIDVRDDHDCTTLITYSNSKDFADIDYSGMSPSSEFSIRVPAVFFHEENTQEMEQMETSGQTIVRLRNEIKVKRKLELGYMPDYMHRKLLLILSHDTIEIDGESWVMGDPYEKATPDNKRFPLKMANVLLTQQGYIKRNIL